VAHLKDESYNPNDDTLRATTMEVIATLKELLHLHPLYNEQMRTFIQVGAAGSGAGAWGTRAGAGRVLATLWKWQSGCTR
jgi:hypothetical protein